MKRLLLVIFLVAPVLLSACNGGLILVVTATPDGSTEIPLETLSPTRTIPPMQTNTPSPTPDNPTPTQETCIEYPTSPSIVVNQNACMNGLSQLTTANRGIIQYYPPYFTVFSQAVSGTGSADRYSGHAEISADLYGYTLNIREGAERLINGKWGFVTDEIELAPGCYFNKIFSLANLTLRSSSFTPDNFGLRSVLISQETLTRYDLGRQSITLRGRNINMYPFIVDSQMTAQVQSTLELNFSVATADSVFTFMLIALTYDPTGNYCNGNVQHIG